MSPVRIHEVLAQNTPQINLHSLLKLPLLGYEQNLLKYELLLTEKREELQELKLWHEQC